MITRKDTQSTGVGVQPTFESNFRGEVGDTHSNHLGPLPQSYEFVPRKFRTQNAALYSIFLEPIEANQTSIASSHPVYQA